MTRLAVFGTSFVLLTVAGALWAMSKAPVNLSDLRVVLQLPPSLLGLLVALCIGIYFTDILRYRSLGEAVHAPLGWKAGLDASVANFFFSWITPGSTFGAPATIFMLGRQGIPWEAAVVIALGKAFTGVAVVVVASLGFVAFGLGPDYGARLFGLVIFGGSVFSLLFFFLLFAALRPAPARRVVSAGFAWLQRRVKATNLIARVEDVTLRSVDRLSHLRDGGIWPMAHLTVTHVLYFAVFSGVGVLLIHAFGGPVAFPTFAAVVVYIAFTYLAPTPGGAGFAEAMAIPFFAPVLPPDKAVLFVLCFRGLTLYMQVGIAIPYLLISGGIGEIVRQSAKHETQPTQS